MGEYIVSARKYRPSAFDAVVGQEALTTTLKNAIAAGKLAHAYLFCGPRGVGKTTCARIFATTINCLHPSDNGEACDECESCKAFNEQRSLNIHELDAASNNSVEEIRALIEKVRIPPQVGRYKVFIIDEVHMLSTAAFNAFLNTQRIDNNVNMDIAAVVVSVRVGTDNGLVSWEMLGTKFLAQCLRPVYGQAVVRCVPWVK